MIELTRDEIDELLREQVVGRLGCHADGLVYVVPLIYAYDGAAVYAATIEGQKVDMVRWNPRVCFEVDTYGPDGWRSAILQGRVEELAEEGVPEALELLRSRFPSNGSGRRSPETEGRTTVWLRIEVEEATGRAVRR